ncbi:MAG: hypothetical protein ACOYZ8_06110 [Chloroflexota bacterium]
MTKSRKQRKARKQARRQSKAGARPLAAKRGSRLWSFNHFRSVVLTRLLDDLYNLEQTGVKDEYCRKIAAALNYFGNAATDIPSAGPFLGPIHKDIEKFTELYQKWNDVNGKGTAAAEERRSLRLKLKDQRHRITNKARKLQVAIDEKMDAKLLEAGYQALSGLVTAVPDLFSGLGKALTTYAKRGGTS